jgi:hypothetical protein
MKYFFLAISVLLVFSSCKKDSAPLPDITSGLVMDISLDGNADESISGTSGNAFHVSPAFNRHGEANKAMQFNRTDSSLIDFGDLNAASFPNNQFTICCWVNVTDTLSPSAVLSKRGVTGPWEYSLDNHFNHSVFNLDNWVQDGSTTVYGVDPLKASATLQLNTWQHLTFVADGTSLKVYVNGVLQPGSDDHKAGLFFTDTDAHFVIGNGGGYGKNYFFNGCIDDVRMYNKALDASIIQYIASL